MVPHVGISYWVSGGNPRKQATFDRLRDWCDLDVLDPTCEHPELAEADYDLYHMAKRRHGSLLDLRRAVSSGIPVLNAPLAARIASDRVARLSLLDSVEVSLPTYQYGRAETIDLDPPVVIKPRFEFGQQAHEFRLVTDPPVEFEGTKLVEECLEYDRTYKLYGLGEAHRAVDATDHWTEHTPPPAVLDLFERVRAQFDLSVFELDVLVVDDEPYFLDLNPAVSLRGVDDGVSLYTELLRDSCPAVASRARSERSL